MSVAGDGKGASGAVCVGPVGSGGTGDPDVGVIGVTASGAPETGAIGVAAAGASGVPARGVAVVSTLTGVTAAAAAVAAVVDESPGFCSTPLLMIIVFSSLGFNAPYKARPPTPAIRALLNTKYKLFALLKYQ